MAKQLETLGIIDGFDIIELGKIKVKKDKIEFDFYEQDIAQIIFMYYNVYHKWYNTLISDIISLSRNEISLYKVYKLISR